MRAAAILGLDSSPRDLEPFLYDPRITWTLGLPSREEADVVLIFGGDGTVHRHLALLVRLGLPVLIVPRGSGNDFARALGIRSTHDVLRAWRQFGFASGLTKAIDLGVITPLPDIGAKPSQIDLVPERYFCCVAGIGLDGEVARRANKLPRWLRGHGGYALSLPRALVGFHARRITILEPDEDGAVSTPRYSDSALLAAFANAPVYGGGMRIAPRARMDDGQLDVCVVGDLGKLKLLSLFPTVYAGRHLGINRVEYFQAKLLRVESEIPTDVYTDGEYVCRTPVEIKTAPGALRVIVPSES